MGHDPSSSARLLRPPSPARWGRAGEGGYYVRSVRTGIPVIVIGLLLSGCGDQPAVYGAHSYSCCAETVGTTWWHAGQNLTLHWQSTPPYRTTDPTAHPLVLSLSLTGPFASIDALKQATSQGLKPAGVRTISAAPVSATDRMVEPPVSQLELPADLPPGFYNLATQTTEGGQSSGGGAVVKVIAPDQPQ